MKVDGKQLLKKLKSDKSDRGKVNMYLSKGLYEDFKKCCGDVPASQVMEELMRQFIESVKKS